MDTWIPNFGQYKPEREGFVFNVIADGYDCIQKGGRKAFLAFKGIRTDGKGYQKKSYRSSEKDCGEYPLRWQCCSKVTKFKKLEESIHKPLYDKMHAKLTKSKTYHRRLVKRRSSTVEPVLGTLINHHNMKRINSRGMSQANKHVLMAALSYNLRKYLKFSRPKAKILTPSMALAKGMLFSIKLMFLEYLSFEYRLVKFQNYQP